MNKLINKKSVLIALAAGLIITFIAFCGKKPEPPPTQNLSVASGSEKSTNLKESESALNVDAENIDLEYSKPNGSKLKIKADKLSLDQAKKISDLVANEKSWDQLNFSQEAAAGKSSSIGFDLFPSWNLSTGKLNLGLSAHIEMIGPFYVGPFVNISKAAEKAAIENLGVQFGFHADRFGFGADLIPNYNLDKGAFNFLGSLNGDLSNSCVTGLFANASASPSIENIGLKFGCRF